MKTCDCYRESENRRYLTDFEQGMVYAKTGQRITYRDEVESHCFGTKEQEICTCGGNPLKCDFYPEKGDSRSIPI